MCRGDTFSKARSPWTDCLVPLADRLKRFLGVDDGEGSPPCNVRDADAERPRVDAIGNAEFARGVVAATADVCLTTTGADDGLAFCVGGRVKSTFAMMSVSSSEDSYTNSLLSLESCSSPSSLESSNSDLWLRLSEVADACREFR